MTAFLEGLVPFGRISEIIEGTLGDHAPGPAPALPAVREADRWARTRALDYVRRS